MLGKSLSHWLLHPRMASSVHQALGHLQPLRGRTLRLQSWRSFVNRYCACCCCCRVSVTGSGEPSASEVDVNHLDAPLQRWQRVRKQEQHSTFSLVKQRLGLTRSILSQEEDLEMAAPSLHAFTSGMKHWWNLSRTRRPSAKPSRIARTWAGNFCFCSCGPGDCLLSRWSLAWSRDPLHYHTAPE